jgi:glucosylceramidase
MIHSSRLITALGLGIGFGLFGLACGSSSSGPAGDGGVGTGGAGAAPGVGGMADPGPGAGGGDVSGAGGQPGSGGAGEVPGAGGTVDPGAGGSGPGAGGGGTVDPGAGGSGSDPGGTGGTGGGEPIIRPSLVTTGNGAFWQEGELTEGGTTANVTVTNTENQTWKGFGGTFNEMGWDALLQLSEADRQRAIKLLFSKAEGAGFEWGRIPIGASDYAMSRYTLNDNANDLSMSKFSIERDKEKLIPFIKAAQAVNNKIKFWGSPWTPPPWMKDNNAYDRGSMKNTPENLTAHAQYFVKFVQEYEKEGIPIDHVQPQNEPGWQQDYPSCAWGPSDQTSANAFLGTFVEQYLAPALQQAGVSASVWYGTLSNDNTFTQYWGNLSASGRQLVKGVGLQWGTSGRIATIRSDAPNLIIMQSEHQCGNYPWGSSSGYVTHKATQSANENAPNDYNYGRESWDLIKKWIEGGVHIYSAWNMVLDQSGKSLDDSRIWHQNAPLVVNRQAKTLILTPTYHVFRHIAQFVDVDAKRLTVQGGNALAFKNPDGRLVAIVHNPNDNAANTVVSMGGKMFQVNIPAYGWATLNYQGG